MQQTLRRLGSKLSSMEQQRNALARKIDAAHERDDVTGVLSLEAQYLELMQAIVRTRQLIHMYNFNISSGVPGKLSVAY